MRAKIRSEALTAVAVRPIGRPLADGYAAHRAGCRAVPDPDSVLPFEREQWWVPFRRQQAGNEDSASEADTAGAISEKLNRSVSRLAQTRRI